MQPPIPVPSEHTSLRQKLDFIGLIDYARYSGGWHKLEVRAAVIEYGRLYPSCSADVTQAIAHAELVEQKIRAATGGR
jgi:uncharacterized protein YfaP (DUF2135 family)